MPSAPKGTQGLTPIQLFPNQGKGYGYGKTMLGMVGVYAPPEGYDRTLNMTVLPDAISPSFQPVSSGESTPVRTKRVGFAIPWYDSNGFPVIVVSNGITTMLISNNGGAAAETTVNTYDFYDGCFHDDNTGNAYIYGGTANVNTPWYINRRTQAALWTQDNDVKGKFLTSAAAALWRTITDYQISKCPAGTDPFDITQWGTAIQVGLNSAKITSMNHIGAAPVVGKEDGIYVYDEANVRFENQFPVKLNAKNFPFMSPDGEGGLFTATAFGDVIHISKFGSITTSRPLKDKPIGRDTPRGPITHITTDGAMVYAYSGGSARLVQPSGMKVLKTTDNFATFTDYTTASTDQNPATYADVSALDTLANGDALLVGFDSKFLAVNFLISSGAVNTNASVIGASPSTGQGVWGSSMLTLDGTLLRTGSSGITLGQGGVITLAEDMTTLSDWVKATYGGFSKYWVMFTVTVALSGKVQISEVSIVVERPAPNFGTTNLVEGAIHEASGQLGHILVGRRTGEVIVWDDQYSVRDGSPDARLCIAPFFTVNSPNAALFCFSRLYYTTYQLPPLGDPTVTDFPVLVRDGGGTEIPPIFYPSAVDLDDVWYLRAITCEGENFTENVDSWGMCWRWDETNAWSGVQTAKSNFAEFVINDVQGGTTLHTAFNIIDSVATDPVGPKGKRIFAWVQQAPRDIGSPTQTPRTVPEVA